MKRQPVRHRRRKPWRREMVNVLCLFCVIPSRDCSARDVYYLERFTILGRHLSYVNGCLLVRLNVQGLKPALRLTGA